MMGGGGGSSKDFAHFYMFVAFQIDTVHFCESIVASFCRRLAEISWLLSSSSVTEFVGGNYLVLKDNSKMDVIDCERASTSAYTKKYSSLWKYGKARRVLKSDWHFFIQLWQ
jgi:hypothetical protein